MPAGTRRVSLPVIPLKLAFMDPPLACTIDAATR